jgi:hypothetical protein
MADTAEPPKDEQLAREEKAVLRGQGTCKELVSPKLVVTDDRVVLTAVKENVLTTRSTLPPNEMKRVDPLNVRLKSYSTHFKRVRAAEPFEPTIYMTLDPALEPARAASLLATASHAGYARSHLYVGDVDLDVEWWKPAPPPPPVVDVVGKKEEIALCIEPKPGSGGGSAFTLRFEETPKMGTRGTAITTPSSTREAVATSDLAKEIDKACPSKCADVIGIGTPDGAKLVDIVNIIKAVRGAQAFASMIAMPPVVLATNAPLAGEWRTELVADDRLRMPCRGAALAQ